MHASIVLDDCAKLVVFFVELLRSVISHNTNTPVSLPFVRDYSGKYVS